MLGKVPATQKLRHRRCHAAQIQGALPPRRVPIPPAKEPATEAGCAAERQPWSRGLEAHSLRGTPGRAGLLPAARPRAHPPRGAGPPAGHSRLPPARPGAAGSIAAAEARAPGQVPAEPGLCRSEVLRELVSGPPTVLSPLPTAAAAAEVPETQPRGAGLRARARHAGRPAEVKLLKGLLRPPF